MGLVSLLAVLFVSLCVFVFGIFLDDMRWAVRGALIVLGLGVMEVLWALFFSYRRSKKANSSEE